MGVAEWVWLEVGVVGWRLWECGGPTQVVWSGGCPGRALGRMGTLVVRITGSSLLVEDVVDGGAVRCVSAVVRRTDVVLEVAGDVVTVRVERLR